MLKLCDFLDFLKHDIMSKQPPTKRQRRTILSEEEYTSTLNDIVQRDYFPDLPDLRRQVAVLDRRAAGDIPGAVAVRRAARQLQQHEEALAQEEQEAEQHVDANNVRKVPRPLHRESVSGFHARVTSEDNAEFDATQRQEVNANRARLQQVFSLRVTNGNNTQNVGSETPLLASDKFNPSPHRIAATEWKNTETGTNGLFFNPSQHDASGGEKISSQRLLTNGDNVTSLAENQLMPPPAPVRKSNELDTSTALVLKQDMVEYIPKNQVEKRIEPSQTRFPTAVSLPPPQTLATRLAHGADNVSSSTDYSTEASTDLDSPMLPVSVERRARAKRLRKEQETLVQMTPQIIPGRSTGNESPIMTWGTVSSTPMVLSGAVDSSDGEAMSFRLPTETGRDDAARRAEAKLEKARRKMKQRKKKASTTPVIDRMTASLTPAARSLLNKATRPTSARSRSAFGSSLRSSYTPQRNSLSSMASVRRDHAAKATPRLPSRSKQTEAESNGNITDGLLKLSK